MVAFDLPCCPMAPNGFSRSLAVCVLVARLLCRCVSGAQAPVGPGLRVSRVRGIPTLSTASCAE